MADVTVDVCSAGGPHAWEFLTAADQQDDSGQRFYDRWACAECGASPPANPVDDPEFYCHGQRCIASGCSPLLCRDSPDLDPADEEEWR